MATIKLPSGRAIEVDYTSRPTATAERKPKRPIMRMVELGWTYAKAVAKWQAAGSPVRPPEEIERIYAICEGCVYFSSVIAPHCRFCGCRCNKSSNALTNKIAMATESCPLNPPKW